MLTPSAESSSHFPPAATRWPRLKLCACCPSGRCCGHAAGGVSEFVRTLTTQPPLCLSAVDRADAKRRVKFTDPLVPRRSKPRQLTTKLTGRLGEQPPLARNSAKFGANTTVLGGEGRRKPAAGRDHFAIGTLDVFWPGLTSFGPVFVHGLCSKNAPRRATESQGQIHIRMWGAPAPPRHAAAQPRSIRSRTQSLYCLTVLTLLIRTRARRSEAAEAGPRPS